MSQQQVPPSDGYRWVMLVTFVLMAVGIWTSWFSQASLLHVYWIPVFHIEEKTGALLFSLTGLIAIFIAIPIGRWVDTMGVRKMMMISGTLACIGFGLRPFFAASFDAQVILTFIAGGAIVTMSTCMPVCMIQWFGHKKGHIFIGIAGGSYFVGAGIGILVSAVLFGPPAHTLAAGLPVARKVLTVWSVVMLAATIIWFLFARDNAAAGHHERGSFGHEFKNVMNTRSSWLMLVYALFISGMMVCAMQFLPGQMAVARHLPHALAGSIAGTFAIAMGIGLALLPLFAGAVGRRRMSIVLCAITLLVWVYYMAASTWTVSSLFIFAMIFGFFFGAPWATGLAIMETLPGVTPVNIGVAAGFWMLAVNMGVFFLPILLGTVLDNTGGLKGTGGMWTILVCYAIALLAMLPVKENVSENAMESQRAALSGQ